MKYVWHLCFFMILAGCHVGQLWINDNQEDLLDERLQKMAAEIRPARGVKTVVDEIKAPFHLYNLAHKLRLKLINHLTRQQVNLLSSKVEPLVKRMNKETSDFYEQDRQVEMGKFHGADTIIIGELIEEHSSLELSLQLLDMGSSQVLKSSVAKLPRVKLPQAIAGPKTERELQPTPAPKTPDPPIPQAPEIDTTEKEFEAVLKKIENEHQQKLKAAGQKKNPGTKITRAKKTRPGKRDTTSRTGPPGRTGLHGKRNTEKTKRGGRPQRA